MRKVGEKAGKEKYSTYGASRGRLLHLSLSHSYAYNPFLFKPIMLSNPGQ